MELLGQDLYIIAHEKSLNSEQLSSLTNMYMPLLSPHAICLYLTLLKRPLSSKNYDSHLHLCETLQCTITQLQSARIELEHFLLLKTYVQSENGINFYIYETQYPLSTTSFLRHSTFARLLVNKVGNEYYERYSQEIIRLQQATNTQEITEHLKINIQDWTIDKENFIRSNMEIIPDDRQEDPYIEYDIISYLKNNDPNEFMIPRNKISTSDVELINSYGLRYQLHKDEMIRILHKCINRSTGKLNKDAFMIACASKSTVTNTKSPDYTMLPLEFATCLLEGNLRSDEIKAIRAIQNEYLLDNQSMNYIIEKSIKNTDTHRIVNNYMIAVAKDLTKKNESEKSNNKESKVTKRTSSKSYRRVESVPEYSVTEEEKQINMDSLKSKLEAVKKKRVM